MLVLPILLEREIPELRMNNNGLCELRLSPEITALLTCLPPDHFDLLHLLPLTWLMEWGLFHGGVIVVLHWFSHPNTLDLEFSSWSISGFLFPVFHEIAKSYRCVKYMARRAYHHSLQWSQPFNFLNYETISTYEHFSWKKRAFWY